MDKEYESLNNNETLDHVSLPLERREKSKFLHGKLEEEIYMENPKEYTDDSLLTCKLKNPRNHYMVSIHPLIHGIPS